MKELVRETVCRLVTEHERNWSETLDGRYFDAPQVKCASADDPLFEEFKKIIGPSHRTPREAFAAAFGPGSWHGGTVICWITPWSRRLRDSNRRRNERPSAEWTLAYHLGLQKQVRAGVLELLQRHGHRGVSPAESDWFGIVRTPTDISSTWSERHAAYVAGLGTFGLNNGFISDHGMTVTLASVITDAVLTPDLRTASHHYANCLSHANGTCRACVKRCPADAISPNGHDKYACHAYAYGAESIRVAALSGVEGPAGCALCQVGTPCEAANPLLKTHNRE